MDFRDVTLISIASDEAIYFAYSNLCFLFASFIISFLSNGKTQDTLFQIAENALFCSSLSGIS